MAQNKPAKTAKAIALLTVAILGVVAVAAVLGQASSATKISALDFHNEMRKLWEDHITWTRLAIVSILSDLPDTSTTVERLLQNQVDIGNAIKPFYGEAAGNQLTGLLHDHITIAAEVLTAAKAGDSTSLDNALGRWYANASEIATFLSSANPKNWSLDMMQAMMKDHLDLTLAEAVAYLQGDYAASVTHYDQVHAQILHMADMLSSGIIRQFPQEFTGPGTFHT